MTTIVSALNIGAKDASDGVSDGNLVLKSLVKEVNLPAWLHHYGGNKASEDVSAKAAAILKDFFSDSASVSARDEKRFIQVWRISKRTVDGKSRGANNMFFYIDTVLDRVGIRELKRHLLQGLAHSFMPR